MHDYDVWPAPFKIASELLEIARRAQLNKFDGRKFNGVGILPQEGTEFDEIMLCDGYCPWHDDEHLEGVHYTALLVLRNDNEAWAEVKNIFPVKDQPVGTLVWLNVLKKHRLNCAGGFNSPISMNVFAALNFDKMLSREEVENRFVQAGADGGSLAFPRGINEDTR